MYNERDSLASTNKITPEELIAIKINISIQ